MLGIIAAIIAAVKGHGTFAAVIGVWTVVAFIIALSGSPEYAVAPGGLFLIIAIFMKNLNKGKDEAEKAEAAKKREQSEAARKDEAVFYCKKCAYIGSYTDGGNAVRSCPNCKTALQKTNVTRGQWLSMSEDEKINVKKEWGLIEGATLQAEICGAETTRLLPEASNDEKQPNLQETTKLTCKNCGEELKPEWEFCNKCGYPVENRISEGENHSEETAMPARVKLICENCGEELNPEWTFCNKCGYPVRAQMLSLVNSVEDKHGQGEETSTTDTTASRETTSNLDLSSLPSKLRRAFILVEDEEWEKAERYFEDVLDEEPENAYAYLGKALIQIKVDSPINIKEEEIREICKTKNFSRAVKYAAGELKQLLDNWKGSTNK